LGNTGLYLV